MGLADAERIKVVDIVAHVGRVHLVDHEQHRFLGAPQHVGHVHVVRGHAGAPVDKKEDDVTGFHGDFRLFAHLGKQHVVRARVNAAGIDQRKLMGQPFHVRVDAVARNAGRIFNDGNAPSGDAVKKCRFTDVGTSHDGDQGFCHDYPSKPRSA